MASAGPAAAAAAKSAAGAAAGANAAACGVGALVAAVGLAAVVTRRFFLGGEPEREELSPPTPVRGVTVFWGEDAMPDGTIVKRIYRQVTVIDEAVWSATHRTILWRRRHSVQE